MSQTTSHSTKSIWISRVISLLMVFLVVVVANTGTDAAFHNVNIANDFYSNLGHVVHVLTWILLVLAGVGLFTEDPPKRSLWFSIPLTVAWICSLAFVGWSSALTLYVIISVIAYAKRFI